MLQAVRLLLLALASLLSLFTVWRHLSALAVLLRDRPDLWLLDWNVYYVGAIELIKRELYRVPLAESGVMLPVDVFNYPPLAAAWALPLLPFGRETGGLVFVLLSIGFVVAGLGLSTRAIDIRPVWLWVPAALFVYALFWQTFIVHVGLGNDNDLVFLLVAAFAAARLGGFQRTAGILLALAIATKIWPVALLVLILRERRWIELRWAAAVLAVQAIAFLIWLGPDVVPDLARAVFLNAPRDLIEQPVIWTTAFRVWWDWWPAWGTYAVAVALVAVPAKGRLGLGLCILGGLALNANLWFHYVWSFVLGVGLVMRGVDWRSAGLRIQRAIGETGDMRRFRPRDA